MGAHLSPSELFDSIAQWLLEQGIEELDLGALIQGLGQKIVAGGIPLHRISLGGMLLHPIFGAMNVSWDSQNNNVNDSKFTRNRMATPEFKNSPFFSVLENKSPLTRFNLNSDDVVSQFPIFENFKEEGITDYMVSFRPFGIEEKYLWANLPTIGRGICVGFSTRNICGFSDKEIEYLHALTLPLALAVKARTTHELAETVLNTYLGTYSGSQVLQGQIERGDGKVIDCILWYADLRDSTALADRMPLEEFLAMVNDYFECVAGAVIDHGGEVLRFIGDAVIAIFPYEEGARPLDMMVEAAVATSREAISRVKLRNEQNIHPDRPAIKFGNSLHVGKVMYGNIGTERRLEFSVIGPAANEVVRLEDFCKLLNKPVVLSESFAEIYSQDLIPLGTHPAAGVEGGLTAYTLPEFK